MDDPFKHHNTTVQALAVIIIFLLLANAAGFVVNGVLGFIYTEGLGGIAAPFAIVLAVPMIALVAIVLWGKRLAEQREVTKAFILFAVLLVIIIPVSLVNAQGTMSILEEREQAQIRQYLKEHTPDLAYCRGVTYPNLYRSCAQMLVDNADDLLGCLELSQSSQQLFPDSFHEPGFACRFNHGLYLGDQYFSSSILADSEKLAKATELFTQTEEQQIDHDQSILHSATSYDDCLRIYRPDQAQSCANTLLRGQEDIAECIYFAYRYQQARTAFYASAADHLPCTYDGTIVFTGAQHGSGLDFEGIVASYQQLSGYLDDNDLYLNALSAKGAAQNLQYCEGAHAIPVEALDTTDAMQAAIHYLALENVYQPCQDAATNERGLVSAQFNRELTQQNIYLSEGIAAEEGEALHCGLDAHRIDPVAAGVRTEILQHFQGLGYAQYYRPCTTDQVYEEAKSLSGIEWEFAGDNRLAMRSSGRKINLDNQKVENSVWKDFYTVNIEKEGGDGYDYRISVVFSDPADLSVREYRSSDSVKLDVIQQQAGSEDNFYHCETEKYETDLNISVTQFENHFGGLFRIDLSAKAECRGEVFDIEGALKTRIPIEYQDFFPR